MLRVLCVKTNDLHLHLLGGVGYIVDLLSNNPWVVGDGGNYAQQAFDKDMFDAKNLHRDLFRHLEPLDRRAMVWRIRIKMASLTEEDDYSKGLGNYSRRV